MTLKRLLLPALSMIAVAFALVASGCGDAEGEGEEQNQPSQAYSELLSGLKDAALSESTYQATRQANDLDVPEEAVIDAFCETVWQLEINSELDRLSRDAYMVGRIKNLAEYDLNKEQAAGVAAPMDELLEVVDLPSLDAKSNHNYKKACYQ